MWASGADDCGSLVESLWKRAFLRWFEDKGRRVELLRALPKLCASDHDLQTQGESILSVNSKLEVGAYVELVKTQEAETKINDGIHFVDFFLLLLF